MLSPDETTEATPPRRVQAEGEPESALPGEEHGRWRYAVVVNTCGEPPGRCRCGFGLRSAPSMDAPRAGGVVLNGEGVLIVERRRCGPWVFLRAEQGGWLPEENLLLGCEVCQEIVDLRRHPSAEDNAVTERSTPLGRWRKWLREQGVGADGLDEGAQQSLQMEFSSRWTYRRGASLPLSAEQAEYWHQGDRWQYCADEPDASCRGDYDVTYVGDGDEVTYPSPEQVPDP